jgi:Zn-dependent M28 family amino/carboxypeptidase
MKIRIFLMAASTMIGAICIGLFLVVQPLVRPVDSKPPQVGVAQLERHVKHLSVDLHPRSQDQRKKIKLAADYIFNELKAAGGSMALQDVIVDGVVYQNIVARFGPSSGPVMVVGAHYDSHGDAESAVKRGERFTVDTHTPGADDNASGVAGLLELARLLGHAAPTRSVELVAFTLEEPPHFRTDNMGSARHAAALSAANREVELMVSLEMIGYFSDEPGSQKYPVSAMSILYPDQGNFIALVGRMGDFGAMRRTKALMAGATDLPVRSINAPPIVPGIDFSDHLNYWEHGFRAVMVTDTAFMRNQNYHLAGDTYDRLNYQRMAKVVQGVYAVVQGY